MDARHKSNQAVPFHGPERLVYFDLGTYITNISPALATDHVTAQQFRRIRGGSRHCRASRSIASHGVDSYMLW